MNCAACNADKSLERPCQNCGYMGTIDDMRIFAFIRTPTLAQEAHIVAQMNVEQWLAEQDARCRESVN